MAVSDSGKVLRVGGHLCINPTNLAIDFPHGGTALGMISEAVFQPGLKRYEVTAEEYGGEPIDLVVTSETVIFGCLFRGMDSDAWGTIWEDTRIGKSSGEKVVEYPGTIRAGNLASARSVKLLYSPDDVQSDPALLLFAACPILSESAELALAISREMVVRVVFQGIRDASGEVYQFGLLEDLTL